MNIVNDNVYLETLNKIKQYIKISSNPINYKKKVLINLMPTFGFKQLIIFINLGEYLKKRGIYIDYFICNGIFNHCDMIKMNDEIDRKLVCERCKKADEFLNLKDACLNLNIHLDNKMKYDKNFFENSITRYCGDEIKFTQYEKETKLNLVKALNIKLEYDAIITINHFQHYSIAPFINSFSKQLILGLDNDKISIFANEKEKIFSQNIIFDEEKKKKIEYYLSQRIRILNNFKIKTDKQVVSFFPNIMQDVLSNEDIIFENMLDWLKKSVEFLLKTNFFVIIKAHPAEKKWKPIKSVINYFQKNENLLLIPADSNINAYDIMNVSDYIATYNGTIFFEASLMNKKVVIGNKIGKFFHNTMEEYYKQFFNYLPYGSNNEILEYAYKLIWTNTFKLKNIDLTLDYPYIKYDNCDEIAFQAIEDIINNQYNVNNYINDFIPIY